MPNFAEFQNPIWRRRFQKGRGPEPAQKKARLRRSSDENKHDWENLNFHQILLLNCWQMADIMFSVLGHRHGDH